MSYDNAIAECSEKLQRLGEELSKIQYDFKIYRKSNMILKSKTSPQRNTGPKELHSLVNTMAKLLNILLKPIH
jgi:hypothetical protein